MCQFLYSEGAAWKRSRQLCFLRMPEAGVKRQQGTSVRRWDAVSPPRCPHKSPCGSCYLHAARKAMEAGGCPICLCQAKLSITSIFQAPFDRLYCWMLHSNKVPTAFFFISGKEVFKIQAARAPEGRENWSASMTFCKFLPPHPWVNSLFSPLYFPKFSSTGTEETPKFTCGPGLAKLPPCSGQWDAESSTAHLRSPSPSCALQCSCQEGEDVQEPEEILPLTEKGVCTPTTPLEHSGFADWLEGGWLGSLVLPHR